MDDTTDTLTRPPGGLLPPPVMSAIPSAPAAPPTAWPGQISQAGPTLPTVTPQVPRPAVTHTDPMGGYEPIGPQQARQQPRKRGFRRAFSWLIVLALLGGLGYAGVMYGPDLIDRVTDDADDADDGGNGAAAALVYPMATAPPAVVRTATFTVSGTDRFGGTQDYTQDYEVTADFESGMAKVVVPRADAPDLEILTLWDQAFIRRIDEPTWYTLPRGDLPLDFSLGHSRWIRTLDELVSPATRQFTTIDDATESSVGTEPARRLVVSVDAQRLLQAQSAASTPLADGSPPPLPPLPAGITVQPALEGVEWLSLELWVDDTGIVRKSVLPPELGGETITVLSLSPESWQPQFPTPDAVQPLTAQVLLRLGI